MSSSARENILRYKVKAFQGSSEDYDSSVTRSPSNTKQPLPMEPSEESSDSESEEEDPEFVTPGIELATKKGRVCS